MKHVTDALAPLDGVQHVIVSLQQNAVLVHGNTPLKKLKDAIEDVGYGALEELVSGPGDIIKMFSMDGITCQYVPRFGWLCGWLVSSCARVRSLVILSVHCAFSWLRCLVARTNRPSDRSEQKLRGSSGVGAARGERSARSLRQPG